MKTFCIVFAGYEFFSRKIIEKIKSMTFIDQLAIECIKALATFPSIVNINKMLYL